MTRAQIVSARRKLQIAGSPYDREQIRLSIISRLELELKLIGASIDGVCSDFVRFVSAWLTEWIQPGAVLHAISDDLHIGQLDPGKEQRRRWLARVSWQAGLSLATMLIGVWEPEACL